MAVALLGSPHTLPTAPEEAGAGGSSPARRGRIGPLCATTALPIGDRAGGRPGVTELLRDLRGDVDLRPVVDAGLAGGLRAWLEDGVADAVDPSAPESHPVMINTRILRCLLGGGQVPTGATDGSAVSVPMARGVMVSLLFRQLITTGRVDDPMRDAMGALDVETGHSEIARFVRALDPRDRAALAKELEGQTTMLRRRWATLPGHWLPRTRDRITIPLGGGRIVLAARIDLLVGTPCVGRASVCLVVIRSGAPHPADLADLHFAALLETLRSGAPPFRAVLHYSESGQNRIEDVTAGHLARAVQRTIDGIGALPRAVPDRGEAR